jgi:hypothetical protein
MSHPFAQVSSQVFTRCLIQRSFEDPIKDPSKNPSKTHQRPLQEPLQRRPGRYEAETNIDSPSPEAPEPRADHSAEALAAEAKKNKALGARVEELEKQLRGSEMRERWTEDAWMRANARHQAEIKVKDAEYKALKQASKENRRAVVQLDNKVRCWQRKYQDLSELQQLAHENPARGMKGRPRWAPAKSNGVVKRDHVRPGKKPTASAQVAVFNDWWEKRFASLEARAQAAQATTRQALEDKDAKVTETVKTVIALSRENQALREELSRTHANLSTLSQQHVQVGTGNMVPEEKLAREIWRLKQTHSEELLAARAEWEQMKAAVEVKRAQLAEQREELDNKDRLIGHLRRLNAKIAMDREIQKSEVERLEATNAQLDKQVIQWQCDKLIEEVKADSMALDASAGPSHDAPPPNHASNDTSEDDLEDYVEEEPEPEAKKVKSLADFKDMEERVLVAEDAMEAMYEIQYDMMEKLDRKRARIEHLRHRLTALGAAVEEEEETDTEECDEEMESEHQATGAQTHDGAQPEAGAAAHGGAYGDELDEAEEIEETEEQKALRAATESIIAGMSGFGIKDSGST